MGCRILHDDDNNRAAMYCSTTERAFGPVFHDSDNGHDARERAELFCDWVPKDPRVYTDKELTDKFHQFLTLEDELWAEKDKEDSDDD